MEFEGEVAIPGEPRNVRRISGARQARGAGRDDLPSPQQDGRKVAQAADEWSSQEGPRYSDRFRPDVSSEMKDTVPGQGGEAGSFGKSRISRKPGTAGPEVRVFGPGRTRRQSRSGTDRPAREGTGTIGEGLPLNGATGHLQAATPELVSKDRGSGSPRPQSREDRQIHDSAQWGLAAMPAPISHVLRIGLSLGSGGRA